MDRAWLGTCITAGEMLYGEYPVKVLRQLYETRGEMITEAEIREGFPDGTLMALSGDWVRPQIVPPGPLRKRLQDAEADGNPYASLHLDPGELEALRKELEPLGLFCRIPAAEELAGLAGQGYFRTPGFTDLEKALEEHGGNPSVLPGLWAQICTGKAEATEIVHQLIKRSGMQFTAGPGHDLTDVNRVLRTVMEFVNHIPHRERKGWCPDALHRKEVSEGRMEMPVLQPGSMAAARMMKKTEQQLRTMGAEVDYSTIDSVPAVGPHGERQMVKVGRNDPCPCGSGKKYKHCHGRR